MKIPATNHGIDAIEEATYRGVNINATISFTLPQALAVAEAVERGLKRREAEGLPVEDMAPVCTLMIGRLDDYLKQYVAKENISVIPESLDYAGIAVFKKAYAIYKERGYRLRLLSAAYRNVNHWWELVGGDLVQTIPYKWQLKINECDKEVVSRIDVPVDSAYIESLRTIPAFNQAYDEDGLKKEEFDDYGATRITLRSFLGGYENLLHIIRDYMVLDFEKKS